MLEAINVYKVYKNGAKELHVLKGIDLKIEKGEFISVWGPSGAGKSTLLHILGGLDEPTRGSVLLEGLDLYDLSDKNRAGIRNKRIGFVFQFYHLLPNFSALENVMLPALIKGIASSPACGGVLAMTSLRGAKRRPRPEGPASHGLGPDGSNLNIEKAEHLLGIVGLKDRINHKPSELSGGEQQRAAIARALINEPEILLCDEPTGNLDSVSGQGIIELLDRLNKENKTTVVVVTHEEGIAKRADKVLHIKDGRLN